MIDRKGFLPSVFLCRLRELLQEFEPLQGTVRAATVVEDLSFPCTVFPQDGVTVSQLDYTGVPEQQIGAVANPQQREPGRGFVEIVNQAMILRGHRVSCFREDPRNRLAIRGCGR